MTHGLRFAAIAEAATGLALLVMPQLVIRLLFGAVPDSLAALAGRVAGIALLALSAACLWRSPHFGMLVYSLGATLLLALVGLAGQMAGELLWPAIILHAGLTAVLAMSYRQG